METGLSSLKWKNHQTTFFESLKNLREKCNYTDATLAVEGKFYPVHKLVMSTCSEYFSDIFERTPCKSPVIVLKDIRSNDVEALLDYMYLGEVKVNQNDLASLLKTAECLKIKDLALPDENSSSTSSHDDAHHDSPPPKRRRHDSNPIPTSADSPVSPPLNSTTALVNPTETPYVPPHSSSNTSNTEQDENQVVKVEMDETAEQEETEEDANSDRDPFEDYGSDLSKTELQPPVVTVEIDDAEGDEERLRRENNYEEGGSSDHDPFEDYGSDHSTTEQEPEIYDNASSPGPSVQQFNISLFNTSNTEQVEPPVLTFEMDDDEENEGRFRTENNYGGARSDRNLGGDYGSDLSKTNREPENDVNTSFPGLFLQKSPVYGILTSDTLASMVTCWDNYATHIHEDQQRWGRIFSKDGYLLMQDFRTDKPPTGANVFNLSEVTRHLSSPRHVYLSFSTKDVSLGRVVIRVNEEVPRRAQQLIDLCVGQTGARYCGSNAIRMYNKGKRGELLYVCNYLNSNNINSYENLFSDLEKTKKLRKKTKQGLVGIISDDRADFRIFTRSGHTGTWPDPAIGEVVSGLPVVKKIIRNNLVAQVTISESGLIIDSSFQK